MAKRGACGVHHYVTMGRVHVRLVFLQAPRTFLACLCNAFLGVGVCGCSERARRLPGANVCEYQRAKMFSTATQSRARALASSAQQRNWAKPKTLKPKT